MITIYYGLEFKTYIFFCVSLPLKNTLWVPWLILIIPATHEVEIRRFAARGQPRQNVNESHLSKISLVVWYTTIIPATQEP
jgi:hypothetical protein